MGSSLSAFRTALLNQSAGLCAQMSSNFRQVGVATALPLSFKLLEFNARLLDRNNAEVYWNVASEKGVSRYILERSNDARIFSQINNQGARNKGRLEVEEYGYNDTQFPFGTNGVYYRLGIESEGRISYSAIVHLTRENSDGAITLNPNPVRNGLLTASINSTSDGACNLRIMDISGRTMIQNPAIVHIGMNKVDLDVSTLVPGMYFFTMELAGKTTTLKFIKE